MTSAQVKSTNTGLMEFMSKVNQNLVSNNDSQKFSMVMQEKTNEKTPTSFEPKEKSEIENQSDSPVITSQANKYKEVEKTVDEGTVNEGTVNESIQETVKEVKEEISEALDITVEELEQVMGLLGMTDVALLDPTQIPKLFAQIVGEEPFEILTNEELSGALNDLIQMVNEKSAILAEKINVLPNEVFEVAKVMEQGTATELQQDVKPEITDQENVVFTELVKNDSAEKSNVQTNPNESKVTFGNNQEVVVEITGAENSKNELLGNMGEHAGTNAGENTAGENTDSNNMMETNSNAVQGFAENIIGNLENAVNEITYTQESVDTEGIMKQIVNHVKIGVSSEVTTMELQLQPESLGKLDLQVALKDGKLVAEFTTENETVKNLIEGQLVQLKQTLEEQGLKVSSVEVSVAEQGLERDMNQNSGKNDEFNKSQKQNVRKINLQGITDLEGVEFEDLNEEEQMAAKLMLENGNTVDYTA